MTPISAQQKDSLEGEWASRDEKDHEGAGAAGGGGENVQLFRGRPVPTQAFTVDVSGGGGVLQPPHLRLSVKLPAWLKCLSSP